MSRAWAVADRVACSVRPKSFCFVLQPGERQQFSSIASKIRMP